MKKEDIPDMPPPPPGSDVPDTGRRRSASKKAAEGPGPLPPGALVAIARVFADYLKDSPMTVYVGAGMNDGPIEESLRDFVAEILDENPNDIPANWQLALSQLGHYRETVEAGWGAKESVE